MEFSSCSLTKGRVAMYFLYCLCLGPWYLCTEVLIVFG